MNLSALLLACSVHADDALLLSVAYVYGRGSSYAIIDVSLSAVDRDDAVGVDEIVSTRAAARAAVARIVASAGEPVLGLLPARPEWALEFGKALDDLLDPCGDIAVASAKLSEFDYACRSRGTQRSVQRRSCTLDLYGRHLGLPALRQAVLADLTLPNPFPSDSVEVGDSPPVLVAPKCGELFFPTVPVAPAAALLSEGAP
jgi:hypothetical protein